MRYKSYNPEETKKIASRMLEKFPDTRLICLYGDLGAGKTIFTKGLAEKLGVNEREIKSPTFTVVREHNLKSGKLYHYDFYKYGEETLARQFLENCDDRKNYVVVEWANNIPDLLPLNRIDVILEHGEQKNARNITIKLNREAV